MKTKHLILSMSFIPLMITSCSEKTDLYQPPTTEEVLNPDDYFSFNLTTDISLSINYGKDAAGSLIELYADKPVSYNEDITSYTSKEALFKIFTDSEGKFEGKVKLPTYIDSVYILSESWNAPHLIKAKIEDGKINVEALNDVTTASRTSRTVANPTIKTLDTSRNIYSIVEWNKYGKISDINGITSTGKFGNDFITNIQNTLWQGALRKPANLDNSSLVKETKYVNTTIAKTYINEENKQVTVENAEIFLTFLTERAGYQSSIGYYYYKSNEAPTTPQNIKKFVIIPNASIAYDDPYYLENNEKESFSGDNPKYRKSNAPISKNTRIKLLFQDANGNVSDRFPAGYTIGYFIISNGFTPNYYSTGAISYKNNIVYSNSEWNTVYEGQKARYISLSTKSGAIVYGIEDGADKSYEDILFCVDANPSGSIQDPDRPEIDPILPEVTTTETTYHTYAYEDIWPTGGDYDLNDVIIEHKSTVTFNSKNYVKSIVDYFTPVQKIDAAVLENAFAIQYNQNQIGNISIPTESFNESSTNSIVLFKNAKNVINKSFAITRTFNDNYLLKTNIDSYINPFIIVNYKQGANNRTEVHLPKCAATSMANKDQIGKEDDAFYIDKSGNHPFSIDIPIINFVPSTEKTSISIFYPNFDKWVTSSGTQYSNWYLKN